MKQISHGHLFNALQKTLSGMKCSTKQMSEQEMCEHGAECVHCGPGAPPGGLSSAPLSKINGSPTEERSNNALEIVFSFSFSSYLTCHLCILVYQPIC